MNRPYLKFHTNKRIAHVGFPNGLSFRWGRVACGLKYEYVYCVRLTLKLKNIEYSIGFTIEKDTQPLDDEDADYDHGC